MSKQNTPDKGFFKSNVLLKNSLALDQNKQDSNKQSENQQSAYFNEISIP